MSWAGPARLLLCRHGQTDFNATLRFQGQLDTELSTLGRRQARLLAARLAREPVDAAYASDLVRARETAELAIASRDVPLELDARLREIAFGRWEGLTFAQIKDRFPEDVLARDRDRAGFAMPGGESLAQLAVRARAFLEEALPRHPGQSLLVVSHGGAVNAIISTLLGVPLTSWWRLRNRNANLSVIDFVSGAPRLAVFNDVCHLQALSEETWPG